MNGVDLEPALPQERTTSVVRLVRWQTRDEIRQKNKSCMCTQVVHYRRTVFDARYSIIILIVAILQPDARQQRAAATAPNHEKLG